MKYKTLFTYDSKAVKVYFTDLEQASNHILALCRKAHVLGLVYGFSIFTEDNNGNIDYILPWRVFEAVSK